MRLIKRIGGIGEGGYLKKAINLALRHKNKEVVAIERLPSHNIDPYPHLKERGHTSIPNNLMIHAGIPGEKYLTKQQPNSFDHLYAHFTTQHMRYADRMELFKQAWRTLKPGTKFVIIEAGAFEKELLIELRKSGFGVTSKQITPEELEKLGTPSSKANAKSAKGSRDLIKLLESLPRQQRRELLRQINQGRIKSVEELKRINTKEVREMFTELYNRYETNQNSQEARDAHKVVMHTIKSLSYETPITVLTATKPKVRHV
jgi:hypothetical protein